MGAFEFELGEVGWFDERVLYLAPTPASPFRELTTSLAATFPDYPPYRGEFPEVIPHLTLAEGASASPMERAARRVQRHLPVRASATDVWLMAPDERGHWGLHRSFPSDQPDGRISVDRSSGGTKAREHCQLGFTPQLGRERFGYDRAQETPMVEEMPAGLWVADGATAPETSGSKAVMLPSAVMA